MKYFPIFLGILLLACTASAITWVDGGGCWTATEGSDKLVMWNTTGTKYWIAPNTSTAWLVVVAAGGQGGHSSGGGGGAGGVINQSYSLVASTNYTVVIGVGGTSSYGAPWYGAAGTNSSFAAVAAMGGGGGGGAGTINGQVGGSGGGASYSSTYGAGTTGQGYRGGIGYNPNQGGGGGGNGSVGANSTSSVGGQGGSGFTTSITGTSQTFACGGGGGGGTGGAAGCIGAGTGGVTDTSIGSTATAATGSGGGGGGNGRAGGAGGSGIIIIRYTPPVAGSPVVSFTSNVTTGSEPLGVQFNDTSITSPTAWNWSFTNVTPGNNTQVWWSTTQNATNTFGGGNWKINLNVTNASGYNVSTAAYWVNVSFTTLTANFTANKTAAGTGENILFMDNSTGSVSAWTRNWSFGDGTYSTDQNPIHSYSTNGVYDVNLTIYNSSAGYSSLNRTDYITISDSGSLSGFNQQDIMMDEIYTLHLTFKDASTLADIPVVTVTDNYNDTTVTTVGTAFLQYNYSTVVIYAVSTGYYGRSQSYLINRDRVETFYLTPETATANVSSQTVTYYSPWQVRIRILDSYGVPLENATVTANYVASTLPSTNTSWLVSAYGVEPITAGEMVNSSIAMAGVTDSNGGLSFTMFKSIQYTLAITNTTAGVSATKTLYPTDQEYIIRVATSSQIAGTNTLEAMQNTSLPVYVLNATAYNLSAIYHDTTGRTSNVMFYVKWRNGTIIHQYDMGNPGTSTVSYNYTIINPGIGTEVIWMYNATRSGL